jgi:hypothetical protein
MMDDLDRLDSAFVVTVLSRAEIRNPGNVT